MINIKRILKKFIIAIVACLFVMPCAFGAVANVPMSEIGDYGNWMTNENVAAFDNALSGDITEFQSEFQAKQLLPDYVPIEAKIGLALMNGLSLVADVLDSSLVRFAIIFMIIAYIFWIMFEAYNMMTKGSSAMELGVNLVKKGAVIAIWIIILIQGPAQIFMWVMGPIISVASYMSDLILNAIANAIGTELPDTCAAIHAYTTEHISQNMILDANTAADMLCVPTRLSGFFATAVAAGWKWMVAGIGHSAFTTLIGAAFIVIFIYNGFKFALMALGVIINLFLGVFMLPFTAIAETISQTSYKGIVGDIFNGFMGLFKPTSLSNQITRFIKSALYFVSLSIVIAVCAALLSGTVDANLATEIPSIENSGFIITLLTGLLVAHLANKADSIAKDIGGSIDDSSSIAGRVGGDIKKLWNNVTGWGKSVIKIVRDKK